MAEKYECKEQVVNVRFMNRQENKGQIHLWRGEKKKKKKRQLIRTMEHYSFSKISHQDC